MGVLLNDSGLRLFCHVLSFFYVYSILIKVEIHITVNTLYLVRPESFLIRHTFKTPFKAPFKNRFFVTTYPYPRSGALTIRIRVPYKGILC